VVIIVATSIYGNFVVIVTVVKVMNYMVTKDYIAVTKVSPLYKFTVSKFVLTILVAIVSSWSPQLI
jgi:hypothetical protein